MRVFEKRIKRGVILIDVMGVRIPKKIFPSFPSVLPF